MNVVIARGERAGPGQLSSDPQFRAALARGDRVFFKQSSKDGNRQSVIWFEVTERGDGSLRYEALIGKPEGV